MRITRGLAALLIVTLILGALAGCSNTDAVARVNGEEITRTEFDTYYQSVVAQMGGEISDELATDYKSMLIEMMIDTVLITQEAEKLGADLSEEAVDARLTELMGGVDEATFEQQISEAGYTLEDVRKSVRDELAREFVEEKAIAEADLTEMPDTYSLLSHILVDDEARANELYEEIVAGGDFAALASANSTDTASAVDGGNLGWAPTTDYVTEFADAADALAVGDVSTPVKSDFGWHIIKKVDQVEAGSAVADAPEDVQALLASNNAGIALESYVAKLREAAKIEYLDDALAPAESEEPAE